MIGVPQRTFPKNNRGNHQQILGYSKASGLRGCKDIGPFLRHLSRRHLRRGIGGLNCSAASLFCEQYNVPEQFLWEAA